MTEINFFEPVIYQDPNRSTAQSVLEAVDEYFYLGDKFRVRILIPMQSILTRMRCTIEQSGIAR